MSEEKDSDDEQLETVDSDFNRQLSDCEQSIQEEMARYNAGIITFEDLKARVKEIESRPLASGREKANE